MKATREEIDTIKEALKALAFRRKGYDAGIKAERLLEKIKSL